MKRTALVAAIIAGAASASVPFPARACSMGPPPAHVVDPALRATDQMPPALQPLGAPRITRGKSAGCSASSCDDLGAVYIPIQATDDQTPSDQIGFRMSVQAGSLPEGALVPSGAIRSPYAFLGVTWVDGASDDQEPIDFTLRVVAIDLAGNESAPQMVRVTDDPGGGCAIARLHRSAIGPAALAAVALLLARRRRRRSPAP